MMARESAPCREKIRVLPLATNLSRALAASARHGSALLATGIFGGLLIPPLAHVLRGVILPTVVGMMVFLLLRIDIARIVSHLGRPARLAAITAFHLLVCPFLVWTVTARLGLDAGIASGVVIYATGCAVTSGAAFARLVGLDPELALLATLATTFLVPLTAPPIAATLTGVDLAITLGGFMTRLALVVGLPLCVSLAIRALAGPARLAPLGPVFDGLLVWLLVLYGLGVMDGLTARLLADPAWVAQAGIAAFAVDFGLNALTTTVFLWMGWRAAGSAGLLSGNRNMALFLAVLPAAADPRIVLFFAICQFPTFLSPFLLRPIYARLNRYRNG
jgi:BASS family bile acid:Na+ symporter